MNQTNYVVHYKTKLNDIKFEPKQTKLKQPQMGLQAQEVENLDNHPFYFQEGMW